MGTAEDISVKKIEVAGAIVVELLRQKIHPSKLQTGMSVAELCGIIGTMYQMIWNAIDQAPQSKGK